MDVRGSNNRIAGRDYYELRINCELLPLDEKLLLSLYRNLTIAARQQLLKIAIGLDVAREDTI